jgi:hypothetical protein
MKKNLVVACSIILLFVLALYSNSKEGFGPSVSQIGEDIRWAITGIGGFFALCVVLFIVFNK